MSDDEQVTVSRETLRVAHEAIDQLLILSEYTAMSPGSLRHAAHEIEQETGFRPTKRTHPGRYSEMPDRAGGSSEPVEQYARPPEFDEDDDDD